MLLSFELIKKSWDHMVQNRSDELKRLAPRMSNPTEIYLRNTKEDNDNITIEFNGLNRATEEATSIPQVKRIIVLWLKKVSSEVQILRSAPNILLVKLAKDARFTETTNFIVDKPITNEKSNLVSRPMNKYNHIKKNGITNIINSRVEK